MAENQVYLIKSGQNSFVEETEAIVGISGGKVGIGTTAPEADLHVTGSVKIGGDLAVDGTFTTINSSTISVDDKNIELGSTDNPTDVTADGGGITVKGTTDKTFNWIDATDAWTSSEHLHLAAGKSFAADGIRALGASGLNIGDDAGNGIFVQDGGKVGIGTTNPGYDLDVDGSGNFTSLYVGGNAVLTGEGSIFGKWEDGAAQGEIFYTGGNVGVGTNNPEYPLHVVGNSVVDGNFVVNGTSGNFNVSDFNVSGDSIVLNYGGGALTSNRGGIIVKDSSFANKTFEYVEGSDYWNSNVGLNITNGGINASSVSAVDANGLTLGDDAGNGIFVEDGGQIGVNTTSPGYNLHVNGSTHVGGEFSVGSEFKISAGGAVGGTAPASDGDIIKWDDANNKWVAGANVGGGGGGGVGEVPAATINSLPSGQSIYEIEFAETYNVEPRIATQLEIDGEGSIIPYVVSGVSTSGYHLIFAQDIPNNNYRIHTTFGGRDVHWETGAGASLHYNDGDVSIQRNFTIGGNLTVNGTTTTVNTETVEIEDHNLVIAANTGYNQLTSEYPGAGGAYAGILWGTGDAGAASSVSLTYQTNKGFAFEGGNVGIGTTSPSAKLSITNGGAEGVEIQPGLSSGLNRITNFNRTTSTYNKLAIDASEIDLKASGSSVVAVSGSVLTVNPNSLDYDFHVKPDTGVGMFVQGSSGNVGIGTANPARLLHLKNSNSAIAFETPIDANGSAFAQIKSGRDGNSGYSSTIEFATTESTAAVPTFGNNGSGGSGFVTRMLIDSSGNVGIGTTNPSAKLFIKGTQAEEAQITISADNTSGPKDAILFLNATRGLNNAGSNAEIRATHDGGSGLGKMLFGTRQAPGTGDPTAAMAIDSEGNVGIGTTNPNRKLEVVGSDGLAIADFKSNSHQADSFLYITNTATPVAAEVGSSATLSLSLHNQSGAKISAISTSDYTTNGNSNCALGFSVASGNVATERMRIAANGNVGIGTTNPGSLLEVYSNSGVGNTQIHIHNDSTGNAAVLRLEGGRNTTDSNVYQDVGQVLFVNKGNITAGIRSYHQGDGQVSDNDFDDGDLRFLTSDHGSSNVLSTRMVINKSGNVGIGTTNPGHKLTIQQDGGGVFSQYRDSSNYAGQILGDTAGIFGINGRTGVDISISGSQTSALKIDSNGNVGIGTTNPDYNLHIAGGLPALKLEGVQPRIWLSETDQTDLNTLIRNNNSGFQIDTTNDSDGVIANRLTILNTNGNVGIGTTNPGAKLQVDTNSDAVYADSNQGSNFALTLKNTPSVDGGKAGNNVGIAFYNYSTGNNFGRISYIASVQEQDGSRYSNLVFGTDDGTGDRDEKMRITSAGNVGIGTTNPTADLHINSSDTATTADDSVSSLRFQNGDSFNNSVLINCRTDVSGATDYTDRVGLMIATRGQERMRITSVGNVGIGNTNPSAPLHISSDNAAGGYNLRVSAGGGGSEDRGIYIAAGKTSPTSAGHCVYIAFHDGDGTAAGGIRNSSTVSNPEFFNGSDVRMKKNIEDCDINGIQKIKSLRLRKWDWNTEKAITPTDIGLVADELEQVFPELVSRQKLDGWEHCVAEGEELLKTIPSESKITLTLLKAIQEQQQMIEDLKSQNASLESRISALES